jgi:hypothetical protein
MPRVTTGEPTKFYSLFVPQIDWFQDLLRRKAVDRSLSDYLIDLIVKDLRSRKILTKKEVEAYMVYASGKPDITKTRFIVQAEHEAKPRIHSTFSLYLPKSKGQEWIRDKLDTEFIKANCKVKSRSLYIWNLFVEESAAELTKAQLAEWDAEVTVVSKTTKVARTKKAA